MRVVSKSLSTVIKSKVRVNRIAQKEFSQIFRSRVIECLGEGRSMKNDKQYEAIKQIMDNPELADEMEKVHPGIKAQMAGYLCSPWLPMGATRKVVMLIIALIAIIGAVVFDDKLFYLFLLILLFFSPRVMGVIAYFCGMMFRRT